MKSTAISSTPPTERSEPAATPATHASPKIPEIAPIGISRRTLLRAAGGAAAVLGIGGLGGFALAEAVEQAGPTAPDTGIVPFAGPHQAGIVTPMQNHMYTAAFDMTTADHAALVSMLRRWTTIAARMSRGLAAGSFGPSSGPYDAPPDDTGEAVDLPAARLTVTLGFGRSLFVGSRSKPGDRFGLEGRLPAALVQMPHFPGDTIDPARSEGDLVVQACADDPQVAIHAIRNLTRAAFGVARIRWAQLGYGRTSSTSRTQTTPRNLLGFKDGTANLMAEETAEVERHVWVDRASDANAAWLAGGTYLAARRIRMIIETWDRTSLREQEQLIGRTKASGSPLSGGSEHTEMDFAMKGRDGGPLIGETAHVRLAHHSTHGGGRMLRRGYNFADGNDTLGRIDAGLFFIAFVRDPRSQFIAVQQLLAKDDGLNEYLRHTASGLFAIPPGVHEIRDDGSLVGDEYLGATLLS